MEDFLDLIISMGQRLHPLRWGEKRLFWGILNYFRRRCLRLRGFSTLGLALLEIGSSDSNPQAERTVVLG